MATKRNPYILDLSSGDVEYALKTFGETEDKRHSQLADLKQWVKKQQHFTCPEDDEFLILFLRKSKYSQIAARKSLDEYVRTRCTGPYASYYNNDKTIHSDVKTLLETGVHFALPGVDKSGVRTFVFRPSQIDCSKYSAREVLRTILLNLDAAFLDPVSRMHGYQVIVDFASTPLKFYAIFPPAGLKATAVTLFQQPLISINSCNCVHSTNVVSGMLFTVKKFLDKDLGNRLTNDRTALRNLQKFFSKRVLPEELGGTAGSYETLSERWAEHVKSKESELHKYHSFSYDESKKPSDLSYE